MSVSGLIPEAGIEAITPEEWIGAVASLSAQIPQLRNIPDGLKGVDLIERELVIQALEAELLELVCLPKAQQWIAEIEASVGVMFGRAV